MTFPTSLRAALLLLSFASTQAADTLPVLDLSQEAQRQVVIAQGTETIYQGHPTTLLMPDGKAIFVVWTLGHGGPCGPMKRSDDGGRTWSELLPVPENWAQAKNCPALYRLTDPKGTTRLFVFAGSGPDKQMQQSVSLDEGKTWSPMKSNGLACVMPFCTIAPVDDGKRLIALSSIRRIDAHGAEEPRSNILAQSESTDGGLTWSAWRVLVDEASLKPCEPEVVRSPDGKQLLCLMRENIREAGSHYMLSNDEGRTWSKLKPLPPGLHGDRHKAVYAKDGRLVVCFRDTGISSPTKNHFVAWVGRYEDIASGKDGEYKIKLLHSHKGADCGYPGLEHLPDGTFVATTYVKYRPGAEQNSVVSTRFALTETDKAKKTTATTVERKAGGIVLDDDSAEANTRTHAGFPAHSKAEPKAAPVTIPPPMLLKSGAKPQEVDGKSYDLVVIGGTPGGIACAVRAAREGLTVLLVNHTQHLGGFVTSGAGGWEAPYDGARSPIYGEMITGAAAYYREQYGEGSPQHLASMPSKASRAHIDRPKVEPRIAELLFNQMVEREKSLTVLLGHIVAKAERDGNLLKRVTLKPMHGDGTIAVSGKVFADGMYEGDLMAAAGVKTQIGRESRAQYGEKHAGVIYTQERHKESGQRGFPKAADEGTLNIRYNSHATADIVEGPQSGEADGSVMAYNYRLVLTRDPANRLIVEKPANFDPVIVKASAGGGFVPNLPNQKVAWNGGRLIGPQNDYPAADWKTREAISKRYLDAMLMRLWWMQNDPEAPEKERKQFAGYGLAADEFPDNHHVPYEIYVREARRLVGRYVFKEQDNVIAEGIARTPVHSDSIAMTDWPVDSVACLARKTEGGNTDGILFLAEESRPAQVPYRTLLANDVDNLLVPVALSASHVGWGAIRLEPTWMQLGEGAGFAAALAVKGKIAPARLDSDVLIRKLASSHVMISFFNDVDVASNDAHVAAAQYFGTKGFFASYDAKLDAPLTTSLKTVWQDGFAKLLQGDLEPMQLAKAVHAAESQESPAVKEARGEALLGLWNELKAK